MAIRMPIEEVSGTGRKQQHVFGDAAFHAVTGMSPLARFESTSPGFITPVEQRRLAASTPRRQTQQVVRAAPCPVLTVRASDPRHVE